MTALTIPAPAITTLLSTSKLTFSLSHIDSISTKVPALSQTRDHTPPTGRHRSARKARTVGTSTVAARGSRRFGGGLGAPLTIGDSGNISWGAIAEQEGEKIDPFQLAPLSTALLSLEDNDMLPSCHREICKGSDMCSRKMLDVRALESNPTSSAKVRRTRSHLQKKVKTSLQDLPEEIMIKIFELWNDSYRLKVHPSWGKPMHYLHPIFMSLVCKLWLKIARQVFYRTIDISTVTRLIRLHGVLRDQEVSSLVRKIVLRLPPNLDLDQYPRELGRHSDYISSKLVESESVTPLVLLREVFLSCVGLLGIEVSGVDPTMLFEKSVISNSQQSLQYISSQQTAALTFLSLRASSISSPITSTKLRSAILPLSSLRTLIIHGYQSSPTTPLSFTPPMTNQAGLATRKLPSRALQSQQPRLVRLKIEDSNFDSSDLNTLLEFAGRDLRSLCIDEVFLPDKHERRVPTVLGLLECTAKDLLKPGVTTLELSLSNYSPTAVDATMNDLPYGPPRITHDVFPPHPHSFGLVERLLPLFPLLEKLRIGGPIRTSKVLDGLPPSVQHLILEDCVPLDSFTVAQYLEKLALSRLRDAVPPSKLGKFDKLSPSEVEGGGSWSRLRRLEVLGASTCGWKKGDGLWRVQKACWDAGIAWKGWL